MDFVWSVPDARQLLRITKSMRKGCGEIKWDLFIVKICGCSFGGTFLTQH